MTSFLFFFKFSLQEQREAVWSEPVGSGVPTERGSNSVEHCPGSNNTAGRRHTAAHCAATEESALKRSTECKQQTSVVEEDTILTFMQLKMLPCASSAVLPQGRFSHTKFVLGRVAMETKPFGFEH